MALPKQVQQQADAVAEYERQVAEQATQQAETPPATPPETPPPSQDTPPNPSLEQPGTASAKPPEVDPNNPTWEQRYRSLAGMIQREQRERQNTERQLQQVTEQLAAMREQLAARETAPSKPSPLVTEQDETTFGSDLVDLARRVAREEFGSREQAYIDRISALESQLSQQVGEVQQTQQQTSRESFFDRLSQAVPAWEKVQATDACQQWLSSRVPGAGFTWNDMLVDAAAKFDAARAIEVFQTFIATQAPAPTPSAAPQQPSRARAELSRQAAPPRTNATPQQQTAERRIYTSAEYASESQNMIRLMKSGKHDEAARIDQELNAALMEGRIRP